MQEDRQLQEVCETLRARIAELLDERNTEGATKWTAALNQEQIRRIRRYTRNPQRGVAKSS